MHGRMGNKLVVALGRTFASLRTCGHTCREGKPAATSFGVAVVRTSAAVANWRISLTGSPNAHDRSEPPAVGCVSIGYCLIESHIVGAEMRRFAGSLRGHVCLEQGKRFSVT
jgi:hypothetical protein